MTLSARLRLPLTLALFVTISYAVATGRALDLHNADSLIPIFVSLEHWTPFYWGQDRFGMLLPLLALPIKSSFWNLVAQNTLGVLLLLIGAYVVAIRSDVRAPALATLVLLASLLAWPLNTALYVLTTNQSYAPALGLYAIAFSLMQGQSSAGRAAGVVAMILGAWTNAGTGLLMLAVTSAAVFMPRLRAQAFSMMIGTIASLGVHYVLQTVAPGTRIDMSHLTIVSASGAGAAVAAFWSEAYQIFLGPAVWIVASVVLFVLFLERRNQVAREAVAASLAGAMLYGFVMALFFGAEGRHATPVLPLLLLTAIIGLSRRIMLPSNVHSLVLLLLTVAVLYQSEMDWPQYGRRRLIDRLAQGHGADLFEAGVTVVTGDYWSAWPYTFALNMLHERVSGTRPVLTVAPRCDDLYARRRSQIVEGTRVVVVPRSDYRYWAVRGPNVRLVVVRAIPDYEIAQVVEQSK